MDKRFIPGLDKEMPLLGFGLMRLPRRSADSQEVDYALAEAMVDHALARGVNYFDTAWHYHEGASELFAGKALSRHPRESYFLADKLPAWLAQSRAEAERVFTEQLAKCRVEYFDFYLMHNLSRENYAIMREVGLYEFLLEKREQGYIRHLGFSYHDNAELLARIVKEYDWDFAQIQLNYVDWDSLDSRSLYRILREKDLPVIIMEPVRGGQLATLNPEALDIFRQADPEASPASWALRYAASLPGVMTVLSGMTSMEQVEDNLKTVSPLVVLSDAERDVIRRATEAYLASGTVPCTGCRYCMDCSAGVDIPRVFAVYNYYKVRQYPLAFINAYRTLIDSEQAHNCVACGECVERCPQGIAIPDLLAEVAQQAVDLMKHTRTGRHGASS